MKTKRILLATIIIAILVAIDQYTKYLVVTNMQPYSDEKKIIGDSLVLYFIKNTGAAWGSFSKNTPLLAGISVVMIIFLGYLFFKNIERDDRKLLRIFTIITIGGAVGNLIDRIRLNYVVDFIYAKFINFPVFNFADICVTVSAFMLVILYIFIYKDDEEESKITSKINESSTEETEADSDEESHEEETEIESETQDIF